MDIVGTINNILVAVVCPMIGIASCTVFHDPQFTVGASGDRRFSTRSLNRIVEFMFGTFRLVAWATKGHKVSEILLIGIYGPYGARMFQMDHPKYVVPCRQLA